MSKIKILIVDDHPLVQEGLVSLLNSESKFEIVGTATTAFEAVDCIKKNEVQIALLDINLPDINGIELCSKLKNEFPHIKCIALSTFSERSYVQKMIENGAYGYLLKSAIKQEIIDTIIMVDSGAKNVGVNSIPNFQLFEKTVTLTRREKEILQQIALGLTNPQIAEKLFLSVLTVNTHRKTILSKFNVNNTTLLLKIAAEQGYL